MRGSKEMCDWHVLFHEKMSHAALMTYSLTKGMQLISCSLYLVHGRHSRLQEEEMRKRWEEGRGKRTGRGGERDRNLYLSYKQTLITCLFFYFYSANRDVSQNSPQFGLS